MRRFIPALVVMVGCASAPASVERPEDILPAVYMIATPFGSGSGTVIHSDAERTVVITAAHVLRHHKTPGYEIHLTRGAERYRDGKILAFHAALDVVLVEFRPGHRLAVARVSYANLEPMEALFGAGYAAREFWVSRGLASDVDRATIHAAPGDSGGAVFDERGRLRGVISRLSVMRMNNQMVMHHVHFVPLSALEEWIAANR